MTARMCDEAMVKLHRRLERRGACGAIVRAPRPPCDDARRSRGSLPGSPPAIACLLADALPARGGRTGGWRLAISKVPKLVRMILDTEQMEIQS